jgi:parallel beta-helix repeat protein
VEKEINDNVLLIRKGFQIDLFSGLEGEWKMKRFGTVLILFLTGFLLVTQSTAQPADSLRKTHDLSIIRETTGSPKITLGSGKSLVFGLHEQMGTESEFQTSLDTNLTEPLSLTSGDFDSDGVPDLICGFRTQTSAYLSFNRGNLDALWPYGPEARRHREEGTFTDSPFLPTSVIFELPVLPNFLGTGDFNGDGHLDVVAAELDAPEILFIPGSGTEKFGESEFIELPGTVSVMSTGNFGRPFGPNSVAIGLKKVDGPVIQIFQFSTTSTWENPTEFQISEPATSLAFGRLSPSGFRDLAIAAGTQVFIVSARLGNQIESFSFPSKILSVTVGNFLSGGQRDLAVLLESGNIQLLRRTENGLESEPGRNLEISRHLPTFDPTGFFSILAARVATSPRDELIVLGNQGKRFGVLSFENQDDLNRSSQIEVSTARFDSEGEVRAFLPMRLNKDAFDDLVVATTGKNMLNIISSRSGNVFIVNETGDEDDADYEDNLCDTDLEADDLQCTLRAALSQASQTPGADDILFEVSTLSPAERLRSIDSVTIDGRVLVGGEYSETLLYLDGSNYPSGTLGSMVGLRLNYNNAVRNVNIGNFKGGGISGTGGGNIIEGNIVGTDITFTQDLGMRYGIVVRETNNIVGGTTPEAANVIGGFTAGIFLDRDTPETDENQIIGNIIGTDPTGTNNLRNSYGIDLVGASQNLVKGNLVKYNLWGIQIRSSLGGKSSDLNQVEGNTVSHNSVGVKVVAGSSNHSIGNTISQNSIFENNGLGIDLGDSGVTPNDSGDPDAEPPVLPDKDDGPNELQNFPVLTRVQGSSKMDVSLSSTPSTDFRIELFQNDACDSSGYGEGKTFISSHKIKTDSKGNASFQANAPSGFITATATELFGELSFSTSEFSSCAAAPPSVFIVNSTGDDPDDKQGGDYDGFCSTGKKVSNPQEACDQNIEGDCECTLRAAIEEANNREGKDTIRFLIPGSAPHKIFLEDYFLPRITDPIVIDGIEGSSAYKDKPLVVIDASNLEDVDRPGLYLETNDSLIRGIGIEDFQDGAAIRISGDNNELRGNAFEDSFRGIDVAGSNNTIGGARSGSELCADPCNYVSGNDWGITIWRDSNVVTGNLIGSNDPEKLGSFKSGIHIRSDHNQVGGSQPGQGNMITRASESGILLEGAKRNSIYGNFIGTDFTKTKNLGNQKHGVEIISASELNTIGSLTSGNSNTIAFNKKSGVYITNSFENSILSNSIFQNGEHGIDHSGSSFKSPTPRLAGSGISTKPSTKPPKGADPGRTHIPWIVRSNGSSDTFTLQFFSDSICEPGKPGQGSDLIGTQIASGNLDQIQLSGVAFFPIAVPVGDSVVVTATEEGSNTSFFSDCVKIFEDTDGNGIPDADEPDTANDPSAATINANGNKIGLTSDASAVEVAVFTTSAEELAEDVVLPGGLLDLLVRLSEQGSTTQSISPLADSTTVTLSYPPGMQVDSYYNYGPTPDNNTPHYYEFLYDGTTGAEIFPDRIVIHFVDGQRGDHDLAENGVIKTRGGPVTNATTLYFPYCEIVSGSFTGFAVSNFSDRNAVVEFDSFDKDGDLNDQPNNPAIFGIPTNNQLALLANEIFETSSESVSWIKFKSDNPKVGSFFQVGGTGQLDGSVAQLAPAKKLFFTRIFEGATEYRGQPAKTYLSIANPNKDEITVSLELYGPPQDQLASESREPSQALAPKQTKTIPGRGFLYGTVSELFGGNLSVSSAYVEVTVTQGEGAVGFERIQLQNQNTVIGLGASTTTDQKNSYSAQLASIPPSWFTSIKLINTTDSARSLTITAVAEDGSNLANPAQIQLQAGELEEIDAVELFGFEKAAVGSLKVEADGGGVIGDVVFGDSANYKYAASLPLQSITFTEAVFNQVASTDDFYTGLALFNPGTQAANVTIEVYTADGNKSGELNQELGPGRRLSKLLRELIPDTTGQVRGFIRIRSDVPLVAQELFGDINLNLLSSVPPTVVQ